MLWCRWAFICGIMDQTCVCVLLFLPMRTDDIECDFSLEV